MSSDPSVTPEQRKAVLDTACAAPGKKENAMPRIIRRDEVARLLGVSVKRIDQLARANVLRRITVPGTSRAIGFAEASVRAIVEEKTEG